MKLWIQILLVVIGCSLIGRLGIEYGETQRGQELRVPPMWSTLTPTVRLTIKTNYHGAGQHLIIDRLGHSDQWSQWEQPRAQPILGTVHFWVPLPVGARYRIGLRAVVGAKFILPPSQVIDLRSTSVDRLERTLEYGNLGEHGQI